MLMTKQEFDKQFRKYFSSYLEKEIPEIMINNSEDDLIWYGLNSDKDFGISVQKKYELYLQICSSQGLVDNRSKNVNLFAESGAQKIADLIRESYPKEPSIQRQDIILTLLPKERLESDNIPYEIFSENMGICIAYDQKKYRHYLNGTQCKKLNLSLKDHFNEFSQNLELKLLQSDFTFYEILKGVTVVSKENAASLVLVDSFWDPFLSSLGFIPKDNVIIEILDQNTICVKGEELNLPRMIYLPLIEYNEMYDGDVFIRKNGKIMPLNLPGSNEKVKRNKKWWEIWKRN